MNTDALNDLVRNVYDANLVPATVTVDGVEADGWVVERDQTNITDRAGRRVEWSLTVKVMVADLDRLPVMRERITVMIEDEDEHTYRVTDLWRDPFGGEVKLFLARVGAASTA